MRFLALLIFSVTLCGCSIFKEHRHFLKADSLTTSAGEIRLIFSPTLKENENEIVLGNPYQLGVVFFSDEFRSNPSLAEELRIEMQYKLFQDEKLVLKKSIRLAEDYEIKSGAISLFREEMNLEYADHTLKLLYLISNAAGEVLDSDSKTVQVTYKNETYRGQPLP